MFYLFDIISIYELYFLSQLDKMNMGHFLLSIGRDDCEKLEHHVVFYTESLKVLLKVFLVFESLNNSRKSCDKWLH